MNTAEQPALRELSRTNVATRATQRLQVRQRLTLSYAASIVALLLASLIAMRAWARQTLAMQETEATTHAIELVQSFFRTELSEYLSVEPTLTHISGELVFAEMTVEFLGPDGQVFGRTQSPPLKVSKDQLFEITRPLNESSAPGWRVRLTHSNERRLRSEERIDRYMLVAVPLLIGLATLVAWISTGRTLKPVRDMAEATEEIARGKELHRLPVANPHDEFGRLGRQFNDLLDQLDRTLLHQRQFLTDAAHELRTPIARMLSAAELQLSESTTVSHEQLAATQASESAVADNRAVLARIHQDLQNVSTLVEELMQLARADAGNSDAGLTAGFLDDAVSDALATWIPEANRRGLSLVIEQLEEAPARINPRLINRLVSVLLGNALGYTPAGGVVTIRVHCVNGRAVLEFDDTGVGIPKADQIKVFDRFFRGREARHLQPGGSGLGLSIAAWIANAHGASISLKSDEGCGTSVTVAFPPV